MVVRETVARHGASRDELIPILNDLNRQLGYLSGETLNEVSRLIGVSHSQLFGVAIFYQMLSTKPLGKHVIQFCESGMAEEVLDLLQAALVQIVVKQYGRKVTPDLQNWGFEVVARTAAQPTAPITSGTPQ